jgi:membrane associated rhomboid family serine protease
MFPLRDENPTFNQAIATFAFIGLNVASWIFIQGLGTEPALSRSVCELGAIPGELLGTVPEGTRIPISRNTVCVIDGTPNYISVLSSMFLHGSWFHLIGNMWFLWVFGDNVEDSMGRLRFVFFYLLCGIAAVGAQFLSNPGSPIPMVGASGAISGIMGAYVVLYPRTPVHMLVFFGFFITRVIVPAYFMIGYWFVLQILGAVPRLGGDSGGVAFLAHVGGFLAGALLIGVFRDRRRVEAHRMAVHRRWYR